MTQHKPTDEQQAVINEMSSASSIMVEAYAGCTKSTTLEMSAPKVKGAALGSAFNKKNATELEAKLPGNFKIKTFNALGHQAVAKALPQINKIILDDRKLGKIISGLAKNRKIDLSSQQWDDTRKLTAMAMQCGLTPNNEGTPQIQDTTENWAEIADALWITRDDFDFIAEMAHEALVEDIAQVRKGTISFDDQIYYSTCLGGVFTPYQTMFVDEYQDLNPLNIVQVQRSLLPGGKLVVVGDSRQGIYAFRGADIHGRGKLRGLIPEESWKDLNLTMTFRCPKEIVRRQQHHAPGFTAWHTNSEGQFKTMRSPAKDGIIDAKAGWTWSDLGSIIPQTAQSMAILCRNNAPLLSMAFKLLKNGVGVAMLGRDIGKNLITLSRKIIKDDNAPADICVGLIMDWQDAETSLAEANDHSERVASINDRAECLLAVLSSAEVRDAGQLRQALEKLFAQECGLVTLSTIHKAKGLEWDSVVHLDPWRVPSKQARRAAATGDHRAMEQEMNGLYVLETRTKHTLVNANLEDFEA